MIEELTSDFIDKSEITSDELPADLKDAILANASQELKVPNANLEIVKAEKGTWPNGCLGVETAGFLCTQALVPGYRVSIAGGEKNIVYHTDDSELFVIASLVKQSESKTFNIIKGSGENDNLTGTDDFDHLRGGSGDDTLKGANRGDKLQGGLGNDLLEGENGFDLLQGSMGNDTLLGGEGIDTLLGAAGDDYLLGGGFGSLFIGGTGADPEDEERLYGRGDRLFGGSGNDTLDGGNSNAVMFGGSGADQFWFTEPFFEVSTPQPGDPIPIEGPLIPKIDAIADFNPEEDSIMIDGNLNSNLIPGVISEEQFIVGSAPVTSDQLFIYQLSSDTNTGKTEGLLWFDSNGSEDGGIVVNIARLEGSPDLNASNIFIL